MWWGIRVMSTVAKARGAYLENPLEGAPSIEEAHQVRTWAKLEVGGEVRW